MKRIVALAKQESLPLIVVALYAVAALASPHQAIEALRLSALSGLNVAPIILSVFAGLGLFGILVDKQAIGRRLGEGSGLGTLLMAAGFGTILVGPVYAIFPLLKTFKDHGARWAVIATIMTSWALKIPMLPLEIRFLGWQFSLARGVLTIVAAIVMGLVFERVMNVIEPRESLTVPIPATENDAA